MEKLMSIVTYLGIFGIPTIFSMASWCLARTFKFAGQLKILMKAQQAQMRGELLKDYYRFMDKGNVTDLELDDWENRYSAYHQLGANGVLDRRRDQILNLPCISSQLDNH